MTKENNKRIIGLDIIRALAVLLVVSVHFFKNTHYYETDVVGMSMRIQFILRNFCMCCVPLFFLLTGFLNNKKNYDKKFFKGLLNIIIIWLFYSTIEFLVKNYMNHTIFNVSIKDFIFSLTSFKACDYSWYIETYIGLYLLTPLLNRGFESFDTKSKKIITLIIFCISILPIFANVFLENLIHIPSSWTCLYILAYYFLGKSIAYFKPVFNKKNLITLLIFNLLLLLLSAKIVSINYDTLFIVTEALLIFLIFYDVNLKNKLAQKIITFFSKYSLDIYLASSLIDYLLYYYFFKFMGNISQPTLLFYSPILVIIAFCSSTIFGMIRKKIINVR